MSYLLVVMLELNSISEVQYKEIIIIGSINKRVMVHAQAVAIT